MQHVRRTRRSHVPGNDGEHGDGGAAVPGAGAAVPGAAAAADDGHDGQVGNSCQHHAKHVGPSAQREVSLLGKSHVNSKVSCRKTRLISD